MRSIFFVSMLNGFVYMDTCNSSQNTEPSDENEDNQVDDDNHVEDVDSDEPECLDYHSANADYAPVQTAESPLPSAAYLKQWGMPTDFTNAVHFAGTPGHSATHEGIDYIHSVESIPIVLVRAASYGTVVYVRTGCPQSDMFLSNQSIRECGSGWGNHIVIDHGNDVMTRYAHLSPGTIQVLVGDVVNIGDEIAEMGNSGRSELRHLHFEMGTMNEAFDPCLGSQSFDYVYDPSAIEDLHP